MSMIQSAAFSHQRTHKASHYHDCHEIIFITKGSAKITVNRQEYTASEGDLVLFSRFEQHAVTSRSRDYRRYVLQIRPQIPSDRKLGRIFSILFNRPERFRNVLSCGGFRGEAELICRSILRERNNGGLFCEDMSDLLTQQLLILICRLLPESCGAFNESCFDIIQQLQQRLESAYCQQVSLSSLAADYGLSVSHLSHLFKRITGCSVMAYLQSCRIAAAKKLLAETAMEVGAVVEACGFSDASNFSRTFRQRTGFTPSQFRKEFRPE